jgi:hypothetical protein
MERQRQIEEVAALLDGELSDLRQVEELGARLRVDSVLKAEFEAQREVKSLLGQLPPAEAPAFMATRVLVGIGAQRRLQRGFKLKLVWAGAGGFAVCLIAVLAAGQFYGIQPQRGAATLAQRDYVTQPGVWTVTDSMYSPQDWAVRLPENVDPRLREYLKFVSQAHGFAKMQHAAGAMAPDMVEAVQVLDRGGGQ